MAASNTDFDFRGFIADTNNKTMYSMGTNNILIIYPNSENMLKNPIQSNDKINKSPLKKFLDAEEIEIRPNKRKNIITVETLTRHSEIQQELLKMTKIGKWGVECKVPEQNLTRSGVIGPISLEVEIEDILPVIKVSNHNLGPVPIHPTFN